jgi:hypothetical protein
MDAIRQILKINKDSYARLVFKHWFHYCELYAFKTLSKDSYGHETVETKLEDFQKLLANNDLYNYWRAQYNIYEHKFIQEVAPYRDLKDRESLKKLYEKTIWETKCTYSKILMQNARKLNLTPSLN